MSLFFQVVSKFTPGRRNNSSLEKAGTFNKCSYLLKSFREVSIGEIYMFKESIEIDACLYGILTSHSKYSHQMLYLVDGMQQVVKDMGFEATNQCLRLSSKT